jgi:ligand-binding sensor domain-containing protein
MLRSGRRLFSIAMASAFAFAGLGADPASALPAETSLHGYIHRSWDVEDGLPQRSVRGLAQTPDGFLWAGTQAGLARFDGRGFEVFGDDTIETLLVDAGGNLLVGTSGNGLRSWRDGRFRDYGLADGLDSLDITALALDGAGRVLVATSAGGLFVFAGGRLEPLLAKGALADPVLSLFDGGGGLYLGTAFGLFLHRDGRLAPLGAPPGVGPGRIRNIAPAPAGGVYLAADTGLFVFENGVFRDPFGGRGPTRLTSLQPDAGGALWLGTMQGPRRTFPERGVVESFAPPHPAATAFAYRFLPDRDGNLWLGSLGGGLHQLRANPLRTWGRPEGLPTDLLTAVAEAPDGTLWIAGRNAGVSRFDPRTGALESASAGLANLDIWALSVDRGGRLWAGSSGQGLFARDENGGWRRFGAAEGLSSPSVFAILPEDGELWVGTDDGLDRFAGGRVAASFRRSEGLPSNQVRELFRDRDGVLWVGTTGGLARQSGRDRFETFGAERGLLPREVLDIWQDELGAIWVATAGALVQIENGEARRLSTRDGLCSDELSFVLGDGRGHLWLGTGKGLVRIALAELRARLDGRPGELHQWIFGRRAGLRGVIASHGAAATAASGGRLFFATRGGLALARPAGLEPLPPPAVALAPPRRRTPSFWRSLATAGGGEGLGFDFAAATLAAPEAMTLRYRLQGYDPDWRPAGKARSAHYGLVPPGRYRFEVEVADQEGRYGPAAFAELEIRRRWGLLGGALLLLLAILGGGWAAFHRLRMSAFERREKLLAARALQALADLRLLRSMLPICSCCKKIRDDDGYWRELGAYFRQHAGLELRRGLCPDCEQRRRRPPSSSGNVVRTVRAVPGGGS